MRRLEAIVIRRDEKFVILYSCNFFRGRSQAVLDTFKVMHFLSLRNNRNSQVFYSKDLNKYLALKTT